MVERAILTGNAAIARGAWEGGCNFAAAYPGTPSTEILEHIIAFPEIYAEWSVNEKVALEVAAGASFVGARALTAMKHVGLNVAADPMFTMSQIGATGGFVIVTADDPGMWSSQDEQDNRHYARHAKLPLFEPSDSREARDLARRAFVFSEEFNTPVLLRVTTRIAHSAGVVELGPRIEPRSKHYTKDIKKRLVLPAHARLLHRAVEERQRQIQEYAETFPGNVIEWGDKQLGIISAGVSYQYAREVFPHASFLKLTLTYPLPEKLIRDFAGQVRELIVVEEGDPIMETEIKAMGIKVTGKDKIPLCGELDPTVVRSSLTGRSQRVFDPIDAPARPPVLCPGCPHRPVFYAIGKLKLSATGDIGCYTLGALPPLNAMDTCVCMGASATNAHGMERAMDGDFGRKLVAVLGDSTFFHSGMTGLVNAVYNKGQLNLFILDNLTTAMTGHQPHPGTGKLARGGETKRIAPEEVARAFGADFVRVVDPLNLKATEETIREAVGTNGVSVIVFRHACALLTKPRPPLHVDPARCTGCKICLRIGCPSISMKTPADRDKPLAAIDPTLCVGCRLCSQVCPQHAIG